MAEQDIEKIFKDAVLAATAAVNDGQAPPAAPPAAPEPIKVTLMGREYTFANQNEYNAAVDKTLTDQQRTINSIQTPPPRGSHATGKEAPEAPFSLDRYSELVAGGDLAKAENYKLGALIFGDGNVPGLDAVRELFRKTAAVTDTIQANAFRENNPSFDSNLHGNIVEDVRNRLNLPATADGYEAAYALSIKRGFLEPQVAQSKKTAPTPPPSVGRNSSAPSQVDGAFHDKLMTMPLEDLEKALRSVKAM